MLFLIVLIFIETIFTCTAALVRAEGSIRGFPLLWKNRDTDNLFNRIVFIKETPFSYLALVDNEDFSGRRCYAGVNSKGFAIINTVAYNLEQKSAEEKDLEGIIMADALRKCSNVLDFEKYIRENLGKNLGSLANFGVMDAAGNVQLFEVSNHKYEVIDLKKMNLPYLIVTNFARSGKQDQREDYLRFERASFLFKELFPQGLVDFRQIIKIIARDTKDFLVNPPTYTEVNNLSVNRPFWINTKNTINRAFTSATILISGKKPDRKDSIPVFWVIPGELLTAPALPFFVQAEDVPPEAYEGEIAPLWRESMRIKKLIRNLKPDEKADYLNLAKINNLEAQGFIQKILELEENFFIRVDQFLLTKHTPEEYSRFQKILAAEALKLLKQIQ